MSFSPTAPVASGAQLSGSSKPVAATSPGRLGRQGDKNLPVTLTSTPRRPYTTIGSPTVPARGTAGSSSKLYTSTFGSMTSPAGVTSSPGSTISLPTPTSITTRQPPSPRLAAAASRFQQPPSSSSSSASAGIVGRSLDSATLSAYKSAGSGQGLGQGSGMGLLPISSRGAGGVTLSPAQTFATKNTASSGSISMAAFDSAPSLALGDLSLTHLQDVNSRLHDSNNGLEVDDDPSLGHTTQLAYSGSGGSPNRSPTGLSRSQTMPIGCELRVAGLPPGSTGQQLLTSSANIPTTAFFADSPPSSQSSSIAAAAAAVGMMLPEFKVVLSTGSSPTSRVVGSQVLMPEPNRIQFQGVTFDLQLEGPVDEVVMSSSSSPLIEGTNGASRLMNVRKLKNFFGEQTPRILEATVTQPPLTEYTEAANGCQPQQQLRICPISISPTSPLPKNRRSPTSKEPESKSPSSKMNPPALAPSSISVDESSEGESCHTFGVPLSQCPPSSKSRFVPLVVELCTKVIEERGIMNQGIYRVPGNKGAIHALELELNKNIDAIDLTNEKWQDVNAITSLLKMFFRNLPEPLITEELYEPMISANRVENAEKRMLKMKKILHEMPEHNFETFRYLAQHLDRVSRHGDKNKMDAHNLSIIFGPTIIRTKADNMTAMVNDMNDQCRIIETIILHFKWFFSSWDEDVNVPEDKEAENVTMSIGAFSEQLARIENKDASKDISAKDVMSSIFSAANKRIRSRKDRGRSNDVDAMLTSADLSLASRPRAELTRLHHQTEVAMPSISSSSSISSSDTQKTITYQKELKDDGGYVKFEYVQRREEKSS